MNYDEFKKCALLNSEFGAIPEKVQLIAEGIGLTDEGYMRYEGETYITSKVKLAELPARLQPLFKAKYGVVNPSGKDIMGQTVDPTIPKENSTLKNLNDVLLAQLESITKPKEGTVMAEEIKKANTVCNIADKLLTIADLSLKAETLNYKKQRRSLN